MRAKKQVLALFGHTPQIFFPRLRVRTTQKADITELKQFSGSG